MARALNAGFPLSQVTISWAVAAALSTNFPAETGTLIVPERILSPPLTSTVKRSSPPSSFRAKSFAAPRLNGPLPVLRTVTRAVAVRHGLRLARGPPPRHEVGPVGGLGDREVNRELRNVTRVLVEPLVSLGDPIMGPGG